MIFRFPEPSAKGGVLVAASCNKQQSHFNVQAIRMIEVLCCGLTY
jgi:hypothetical protein